MKGTYFGTSINLSSLKIIRHLRYVEKYPIAREKINGVREVNIVLLVFESLFKKSCHHNGTLVVHLERGSNLFLEFFEHCICTLCVSSYTDDSIFSVLRSFQDRRDKPTNIIEVSERK